MSTCRGDKYRCQPCCCHNKQIGVSSRSFFTHLHNGRVWDFQLCQWLRVKFKLRVFWRQLSWLSLVVVVVVFCDRLRVGGGLAGAVSGEDEKGAVERSAQDQPSLHRYARHIVVWIQTWEEMKWLVYILTWVYLGEAESPHHARVVLWVGDWACHLEYPDMEKILEETNRQSQYIIWDIFSEVYPPGPCYMIWQRLQGSSHHWGRQQDQPSSIQSHWGCPNGPTCRHRCAGHSWNRAGPWNCWWSSGSHSAGTLYRGRARGGV